MSRKKRTPKNSSNRAKKKEKLKNVIILAIFIIFIAIVTYLFYNLIYLSASEEAVAVVNGESISKEELDWWYRISILPEHRDVISKQKFLALSLIPQEILVQKAVEEGIEVTQDDVEIQIGKFIIDNGLTLEEFEEQLKSRNHSIDDVKKSFQTRSMIIKLLQKENISFDDKKQGLFFDESENDFQDYLANLIDKAEVEIYIETIEEPQNSFEATRDILCDKEKPIVRLYTTSWCQVCEESGVVFKEVIQEYVKDDSIKAFHWSLDTGDNLLTSDIEKGVPEEEAELFKKYSQDSQVPALILGCKYKRIGSFTDNEADEFIAILKGLVGG